MTTKYKATAPDGTVFKRTTKGRKYSHCVAYHEVGHSYHPYDDNSLPLIEVKEGWCLVGFCGTEKLAQATARRYQGRQHIDAIVVLAAVEI